MFRTGSMLPRVDSSHAERGTMPHLRTAMSAVRQNSSGRS